MLSMVGNSLAGVVLPLVVLQVTGSAWGAGVVAAVSVVPAVLAGLFTGVVIDRIDRRTASVLTDLVSAAAIGMLPLVELVGELSLGWFVASAVLGSLGDVPGLTAREALLPAIVRHGGMGAERLTGMREGLGALALLLGPAGAGALMVLLDGAAALWITAAASLAAALVTLLIPRGVGAVGGDTADGGRARLREGWLVLVRSPFLMAVTGLSLAAVFVLAAFQALILPVAFLDRPGLLGFVLSAMAAGMLVGGVLYAVAGRRGSRRAWFVAGLAGVTGGFALIAALSSAEIVLAGAFAVGLSSGLFNGLLGVLMIERIPEAMRGRIMGTQNAMMTAAAPVAVFVAAALTEAAGPEAAAVILVAVWAVAAAASLSVRALRTLEETDGAAEGVRA
ncbi:MFS transporter [Actinocorallia populi]|uniref:MFS transporter n=1 Tax=Actinocorallia populi TaxID=2079200 RepID=UPI0022B7FF19|nr:MFS transporter [Actinocorallia populi]